MLWGNCNLCPWKLSSKEKLHLQEWGGGIRYSKMMRLNWFKFIQLPAGIILPIPCLCCWNFLCTTLGSVVTWLFHQVRQTWKLTLVKNMYLFQWEQFLHLAWCLLCEQVDMVFSLSMLGNCDHCITHLASQQQLVVYYHPSSLFSR